MYHWYDAPAAFATRGTISPLSTVDVTCPVTQGMADKKWQTRKNNCCLESPCADPCVIKIIHLNSNKETELIAG